MLLWQKLGIVQASTLCICCGSLLLLMFVVLGETPLEWRRTKLGVRQWVKKSGRESPVSVLLRFGEESVHNRRFGSLDHIC